MMDHASFQHMMEFGRFLLFHRPQGKKEMAVAQMTTDHLHSAVNYYATKLQQLRVTMETDLSPMLKAMYGSLAGNTEDAQPKIYYYTIKLASFVLELNIRGQIEPRDEANLCGAFGRDQALTSVLPLVNQIDAPYDLDDHEIERASEDDWL